MASRQTTPVDKGKGKEVEARPAGKGKAESSKAAASNGPVIGGTRGDWTAVWSAERGAYYFWNKSTGVTSWENPFEKEEAPASAEGGANAEGEGTAPANAANEDEAASADSKPVATSVPPAGQAASSSAAGSAAAAPTAEDYGGIDPELAFLDPSLAGRRPGGPTSFTARFNARTGKFEGDPNRNPDHVSDVSRAKRQNQFYFDYSNWEKTLAQEQEQKALKRGAGELDGEDDASRKRPSKKEMAAIRERNKEKKDKRQKGWLLG